MRRSLFLILPVVLLLLVGLTRLTANWHYVIPAQPGAVLYTATFDAFSEDWGQYDDGQLSAQVRDGFLRLEVAAPQRAPFSVARPHFSDFDLRVQASPVNGPLDNGYGVIFRLLDPGNYYYFLVSSDGYYKVSRFVNGVEKLLSDWDQSPLVNQGLGVSNLLRVVGHRDTFQFYVNGGLVQLCIPDDPEGVSTFDVRTGECMGTMVDTLRDSSASSGQLGFIAVSLLQPGVVVEFDNMLVLGPQPITE